MSSKTWAILILAVAVWGFWKYSTLKEPAATSSVEESPTKNTRPLSRLDLQGEGKEAKAILHYVDSEGSSHAEELSANEKSFALMARSFLEFTDEKKSKEDFIDFLRSQGLRPIVAEDKQDVIEDLTVIRTENSLPGLRYIHAQFDGDGEQELQHLSFEIQKGVGAHQKAIDLIQKVLPVGDAERVKDTDSKMAIFKRNGYVIWLKELTIEDMMGDPYNAYGKQDEGNVRVAIERDIHAHELEGEGHEHAL